MTARTPKPRLARVAALPEPQWTPELVGDALVTAMRWAASQGPVGPRGYNHVRFAFSASLDDHLDEGWGLPEVAGQDEPPEDRPLRLMLPPAVVSRHRAALEWPATYLCPADVGSARALGLWAACKATGRSFDGALKARATMHRSVAYRLRDKGLSLVSVGLARDGVLVDVAA